MTVSTITDAVFVIARADRQRTEQWIAKNCDPRHSSPPIARQAIASIESSDPAITVLLHCMTPGRGWARNNGALLFAADERAMAKEMCWVRDYAAGHGSSGTLSVSVAAVIACAFDTEENFQRFVDTFSAHVFNKRSFSLPE